jgi:mono/diheme cytochrome c family protein
MRFKIVTCGIAILVAVGIWQVRADQQSRAKKGSGPDAGLVKHGEYLVNEVAHCSHCHSPQDARGMPDRARLLRGASLPIRPKKETKNWADESPDITSAGLAGKWGEEAMIKFLMTGIDPEGEKPMSPMPVFRLNARDARAVTLYLQSLPGSKGGPSKTD